MHGVNPFFIRLEFKTGTVSKAITLEHTLCRHPIVGILSATRGNPRHDDFTIGFRKFNWRDGVPALSIFLLKLAAWWARHSDNEGTLFQFRGGSGHPVASLSGAIDSNTQSLRAIFGDAVKLPIEMSDIAKQSYFAYNLVDQDNPRGKDPNRDIVMFPLTVFAPGSIQVIHNDAPVCAPGAFDDLADRIWASGEWTEQPDDQPQISICSTSTRNVPVGISAAFAEAMGIDRSVLTTMSEHDVAHQMQDDPQFFGTLLYNQAQTLEPLGHYPIAIHKAGLAAQFFHERDIDRELAALLIMLRSYPSIGNMQEASTTLSLIVKLMNAEPRQWKSLTLLLTLTAAASVCDDVGAHSDADLLRVSAQQLSISRDDLRTDADSERRAGTDLLILERKDGHRRGMGNHGGGIGQLEVVLKESTKRTEARAMSSTVNAMLCVHMKHNKLDLVRRDFEKYNEAIRGGVMAIRLTSLSLAAAAYLSEDPDLARECALEAYRGIVRTGFCMPRGWVGDQQRALHPDSVLRELKEESIVNQDGAVRDRPASMFEAKDIKALTQLVEALTGPTRSQVRCVADLRPQE